MAWRRARSLFVLEAEIQARYPGTTVWDKGDPAHQATWSDHNPNTCCDVVCAIDVLPNGGMSLRWFADTVVATDPPALKYVIYNRRIWFPGVGWAPYFGSNPHTGHAHVSVGVGPDGRSTGPYDDTSSWGIARANSEGGMMLPQKGDKGPIVQYWQRMLRAAGHSPGEIDGEYGPKTEAAVNAFRASLGWAKANYLTAHTAFELQRRVFSTPGPAGPPGAPGEPGPPGDLRLPPEVTGQVTIRLTESP